MTVLGSNLSETVSVMSASTGADEVRNELAAAHRIAARLDFVDLIHNHFSARLVDVKDKFLMTPYGYWFSEVTKSTVAQRTLITADSPSFRLPQVFSVLTIPMLISCPCLLLQNLKIA